MSECDQLATDALGIAQSLTHKGVIAHEAEGFTPALVQKPGVRPPVTGASNAWPAETWEAHDMPPRQQQRLTRRQVGSGSGLAKANGMGPSIVTPQRCRRGGGICPAGGGAFSQGCPR